MKPTISRRDAIKLAAAGVAGSTLGCTASTKMNHIGHSSRPTPKASDSWRNTHDRTWLGSEYWANPMEDWKVSNGGVECLSTSGNRSVHSLTHQLNQHATFTLSVDLKRTTIGPIDGGAGIRLGVTSDINEYRSNCFVQQGFDTGIINNQLALGNKRTTLARQVDDQEITLTLSGEPHAGAFSLTLTAQLKESNETIATLNDFVSPEKIMGNICIVSNFQLASSEPKNAAGTRYRFSNWQLHGNAFSYEPNQRFGPILWAMYTLSNSRSDEGFVMKLSALTGPLGENDNKTIELQIKRSGHWKRISTSELDPDAWIANFRIANWDSQNNVEYRLIYKEKLLDGHEAVDTFSGIIQANPTGRKLRMAALTCQNDYAFPYAPVANNVVKLKPDLILFSGDQIYEDHGGFGVIREPTSRSILNYLRKFYQFGWAFKESMRNAPTVCLPDDHDVLQGNLWGDGGSEMSPDAKIVGRSDAWGGYIQAIRMVNVVHRTHTSHLPDPIDPTPADRGLNVYYTEMVYGDVSFAILADRQWKSGPDTLNIVVGESGRGEDPSYINPSYDQKDLQLLGPRQEAFLTSWAEDWRDHSLKAVLSQTVFAGISTHQPQPDKYLKYDFDSSGWPATARNRAIEIMRKSKALHICGDTHLGSLAQYGVHTQRDSNWAFCTPAIAAGWPRWWRPDDVKLAVRHRPTHGLSNTGEYMDSFGNKIYVYAVGNPEIGRSKNRYIHAHEKGSGFGFILFDTKNKTYTVQAFRFLTDATKPQSSGSQFPGWPVTIHQDENNGSVKRIL